MFTRIAVLVLILAACARRTTAVSDAASHPATAPGSAAQTNALLPSVPLTPPDSVPRALFDSLGTAYGKALPHGPVRKGILIVAFQSGTPLVARQAAIDSVGGVVVGGDRYQENPRDGYYYVRISGGSTADLMNAGSVLKRQSQVVEARPWALASPSTDARRFTAPET